MAHSEAKFLFSCKPVKPGKLEASNMQWWDRHRLDTLLQVGYQVDILLLSNRKEGMVDRPKASPKPSKENSIISYSSKTILFGLLAVGCPLCPAGRLTLVRSLHRELRTQRASTVSGNLYSVEGRGGVVLLSSPLHHRDMGLHHSSPSDLFPSAC